MHIFVCSGINVKPALGQSGMRKRECAKAVLTFRVVSYKVYEVPDLNQCHRLGPDKRHSAFTVGKVSPGLGSMAYQSISMRC